MIKSPNLVMYGTFSKDGGFGTKNVAFAPPKGVIVDIPGSDRPIATCSAVVYLDLVIKSIEELEALSAIELAGKWNTSIKYSAIVAEKLLATLRWQASMLSVSREVVVGIVTANEKTYYATGRRISRDKKESVLAKARRMLPVGSWGVYALSNDSRLYAVPQIAEKSKARLSATIEEITSINTGNKKPHYLFIMDSDYFRAYCGRTLLTSKKAWGEWDEMHGGVENLKVCVCRHGEGVKIYTPQELSGMKDKDLFPPDSVTPINLEVIGDAIYAIAGSHPDGCIITIYATGHADGAYAFASMLIKDVLKKGMPVKLRFSRGGAGGSATVRRCEWRIGYAGYPSGIPVRYDLENNRLRVIMNSLDNEWPSMAVGVAVGNKLVQYGALKKPTSVEGIAKILGATEGNILAQCDGSHNNDKVGPPYLYNSGGVMMMLSGNPRGGVVAGMPTDKAEDLKSGTYFYYIDKDLSMLLANA